MRSLIGLKSAPNKLRRRLPPESLLKFRILWRKNLLQNWLKVLVATFLAVVGVQSFRGSRTSAQGFPSVVGRIEGDDLEVVTTTPSGIERDAAPTVVASGSEVTLRSGHALLMLNAGGEISVCGPAHFKMLMSSGALTLALDYGRVHPSLESQETFTIYMPTVIATPIAIGGGRRDMTLGLDQGGEMCVLTRSGAMRVEPQFSDQSLLIPQGGTVNMSGGQIDSLPGEATDCSCAFPRASMKPVQPVPAPPPIEISTLHRPMEPEAKKTDDTPPPAPATEPVYTVIMPPLTFDAHSPAPPPDPDPETVLLVREVRLRPAVVFRGHVNPAPSDASAAPSATLTAAAVAPRTSDDRPANASPGLTDRVRNFIHKLTGWGPCAGAGCKN